MDNETMIRNIKAIHAQVMEHMPNCQGRVDALFTLENMLTSITLDEQAEAGFDALEQAKRSMEHAEQMESEYAAPVVQWSMAYAAVAQAEQLKRIADMIEGYCALYLDPAIVAVAERRAQMAAQEMVEQGHARQRARQPN